ncbi:hypothetical protein KR200_004360 [Drosophila serrata]|nr:hypothetical protein KR200_004360 [Drosophila serrata]
MKLCKVEDETCFVAQAQAFLKAFKLGIPELQVGSLEPLNLGTVRVESGGHSESVSFKLLLTQAKLYDLANKGVVKSLKGFVKDPTFGKPLKLVMVIDVPQLELRAKYDVNGKLLILPIISKGDVSLKMNDVQVKSRITAMPEKRSDGHTYLSITDYKVLTKIKSANFNMSNLFNDNVELRESTLKVLNQEWNTLAVDIQPKINEASAIAMKSILQQLWNNIPYDSFFTN